MSAMKNSPAVRYRSAQSVTKVACFTDYLKDKESSLSEARKMANHTDTRTTQLYDRRAHAASVDEYAKVAARAAVEGQSLGEFAHGVGLDKAEP